LSPADEALQPGWFDSYPELLRDLRSEGGCEPLPQLTWLPDFIGKKEQKREQEKVRRDALLSAVCEGDAAAILVLVIAPARSDEIVLRTPEIIDLFGQQANFQVRVVYSAAELKLEDVAPGEIDREYIPDWLQ
jgi:hypothetical protein